MVAFRSTIDIAGTVSLEVFILPKWGFYGFVAANMLSLMISQSILYLHRQIQHHPIDDHHEAKENESTEVVEEQIAPDTVHHDDTKCTVASQTGISIPLLCIVLVSCLVLHFVGCSV